MNTALRRQSEIDVWSDVGGVEEPAAASLNGAMHIVPYTKYQAASSCLITNLFAKLILFLLISQTTINTSD